MGQRLDFDDILMSLMPEGKKNVYFQPPSADKMQYPCIVYNRENANTKFADNSTYSHTKRYQVTLISRDPDQDDIYDGLAALPMSTFNRFFVSDNLNHDVFIIYF